MTETPTVERIMLKNRVEAFVIEHPCVDDIEIAKALGLVPFNVSMILHELVSEGRIIPCEKVRK
jgi:predicted transcriptional regulator